MMLGWAVSFEDPGAGIAAIQDGFEKWRTTAGCLLTTYYSLLYADALLRAGRREEAVAVVDQAIAFGEARGRKCS